MTDENDKAIIPEQFVISKIYYIRGNKVMLDRDLAELYGVEPIRLREQVKRNKERFPAHFIFQLNENEIDSMVSQIAIPSRQHLGGHLPYAFTEHGVLMLANVLRSKKAMEVSVRIVEIFVKLLELILTQKDILLKLEQLEKQVLQNSEDIQTIFSALKQLLSAPNPPREMIGFKAAPKASS